MRKGDVGLPESERGVKQVLPAGSLKIWRTPQVILSETTGETAGGISSPSDGPVTDKNPS